MEINNTDAEGRLVLSDGVAYAAKELHCSTILDMATLTGAQGTATGVVLYCLAHGTEEASVNYLTCITLRFCAFH